ncbi:DNA-methyltransferase [Priestia megaterium]|uniref:DNA-methyltransferase n=1 Tax=Priestia megaterium TaxID=1404 RepID=UPI002877CCD1|nr:site-specific DNA-methyltransferase [Priestia megaterium]
MIFIFKSMSFIYNEDCLKGVPNLSQSYSKFADAVITSPPYAEQRKNQYGGIPEKEYPQWTVEWMNKIETILKDEGSVFINIRPHLKNGQISDYVLQTRLALREAGWKECEEIIWIKPDSPPLGSINRPRRAWESVLWFSKTNKPFVDLKAGGNESSRIGFENNKFEHGGKSHIHAGQNKAKQGKARVKDYIEAGTSKVEKGFSHSAMFPPEVVEYLINLSCPKDGIVFDPFMGSGTVARQAIKMDRGFCGFEINDTYYGESLNSIHNLIIDLKKEKDYEETLERILM